VSAKERLARYRMTDKYREALRNRRASRSILQRYGRKLFYEIQLRKLAKELHAIKKRITEIDAIINGPCGMLRLYSKYTGRPLSWAQFCQIGKSESAYYLYIKEQQRHKDKARDHNKRLRIGRIMHNGVTLCQWIGIQRWHGYRCAYCGVHRQQLRKLGKSLEMDHYIPLSKGGENSAGNIVPACMKCNRAKSDADPRLAHRWRLALMDVI
jgi:5-methylcytosine-specific restriction endonuclease McrA